jgi:hypothetical protein
MSAESENKESSELDADVITLEGGTVDAVEAESVQIVQSGARTITASEVSINTGMAISIEADQIAMQQSGAFVAQARQMGLDTSTGFALLGNEMEIEKSRVGMIVARDTNLSNSSTIVLLAKNVNGPVETLLDTRGAIYAGLIAGIAMGMVRFVGSLLTRRR